MADADDLLGKVQRLEQRARRIADEAEKAGDRRTALQGVRELVRVVELLAKLRGELQSGDTVNVLVLQDPLVLRLLSELREVFAEAPDAVRQRAFACIERAGSAV